MIVLVAAAVAVKVFPGVYAPSERAVEQLVTVALIFVLFDGGLHIGWGRFRQAGAPIVIVGVFGTFGTVAAAAGCVHLVVGVPWYLSVLVATAVSPTDPAVVFSVLGQREVFGRGATILEGESGANDPVGIALMTSLIAAGSLGRGAFAHVVAEFCLQMGIGAAIGWFGARALLWFIRSVPLPGEALYPLRTAACAVIVFAVATLAHGSGFLAVFVTGILIGDARAPYEREIERFHSALASLGEIVAFVVLGLTVDLHELTRAEVWLPGVGLGAALAFAIRPSGGRTLRDSGAAEPKRKRVCPVRWVEGRCAAPARRFPPRRTRARRRSALRDSRLSSSSSRCSCKAASFAGSG